MHLNKKILGGLALGLGLAAASCSAGTGTQKPGIHGKDTIKEHRESGKEDTANIPEPYDPNNCPACGMG